VFKTVFIVIRRYIGTFGNGDPEGKRMLRVQSGVLSVIVWSLCLCRAFGADEWSVPPRIGEEENGHKASITSTWTQIAKEQTKQLTANRASTDKDTFTPDEGEVMILTDGLSATWPKWRSQTGGTFSNGGLGQQVSFTAGTTTGDHTISLYEEDAATAVGEGAQGTRDDPVDVADYGQLQDSTVISVSGVVVQITVAMAGNTTNTAPGGPNSQGKRGLWNAQIGNNEDVTQWTENPGTGGTSNGTSNYTGIHPLAQGVMKKTEIYGHITDRGGYADAVIEENAYWRIKLERKGWIRRNQKDYQDTTWTTWSQYDPNPVRYHSGADTEYDLANNYLYTKANPGLKNKPGNDKDKDGEDVTRYDINLDFRLWIEFKDSPTASWRRSSEYATWGISGYMNKQGEVWLKSLVAK